MIRYCLSLENQEKLILPKQISTSGVENIIIINNIIENLLYDRSYFFTKNFFEINYIEIRNMAKRNMIKFNLESLFQKNLKHGNTFLEYVIYDDDFINTNEKESEINNTYQSEDYLPSNKKALPYFNSSKENNFNSDRILSEESEEEGSKNKEIRTESKAKNVHNLRLVIFYKLIYFFSEKK